MIISVNKAQLNYITTALKIYEEEIGDAANAVHSRLLKEGWSEDAAQIRRLIHELTLASAPVSATEQDTRIRELCGLGRRIEAIKFRREQTGEGLKDAKDYVDSVSPPVQNRY